MPKAQIVSLPSPAIHSADWSAICKDLCVESGNRRIIHNISCRLSAEGISVIMGENGAGKSIFLKTVAGLIKPASGYVQLHPNVAGRSAMVFQRPVLLRRSVRGNLEHALKVARFERSKRRHRIDALLESCGLAAYSEQSARSLSGGEQQRLQMARALASNPRLILMDEPAANLDPAAVLSLEDLIRAITASGVKIALVTHNLGQVRRLADEALFLSKGHLVEQGHPERLLNEPRSKAVQAYLDGKLLA